MLALGPQASKLILISSYITVAAHANRRAEKAHGRAVGGRCVLFVLGQTAGSTAKFLPTDPTYSQRQINDQ